MNIFVARCINTARWLGLLNREMQPSPAYPYGYSVPGILPMLWLWVTDVITYPWREWVATWHELRQHHGWLNSVLPGDVWEIR